MTPLEYLRSLRGGRRRQVYVTGRRGGRSAALAVSDETARFETVVPALAGENSDAFAMPEEIAEIIRGHTGAEVLAHTFTDDVLAYEAPLRRAVEERMESVRPAIETAMRFARAAAERGAQAPVVGIDGDEVVVLSDTGMNITWAADEEHRMSRARLERWVSDLPARPPDAAGMPAPAPALEMAKRIAQRHRDATCQVCMTRYSRCYCKEDSRA